MSKKEWLQEAFAVVIGMVVIFAAAAILLLVGECHGAEREGSSYPGEVPRVYQAAGQYVQEAWLLWNSADFRSGSADSEQARQEAGSKL